MLSLRNSASRADHEVARHPEVVTLVDALARADLELPLAGHHLRVLPRDGHARVQAAPPGEGETPYPRESLQLNFRLLLG